MPRLSAMNSAKPQITDRGAREIETVLQAANQHCRTVPMPLAVCLDLRRRAAEELGRPDPLSTAQQRAGQAWRESIREPELARLLQSDQLGDWALSPASINRLVELISARRPVSVLEFGCGSSTIALAWALRASGGSSGGRVLFSVEQSLDYLEQTRVRVEALGLAPWVRFLHAPLCGQTFGSISTSGYGVTPAQWSALFGEARPECVLIDGPAAGHGGRFATLPSVRDYLAPGASVYLDDALRDSELATADWWSRLGYLTVEGVWWIGKGLLVGRVPDGMESSREGTGRFLSELLTWSSSGSSGIAAPAEVVAAAKGEVSTQPKVQHVSRSRETSMACGASLPGKTCVFINTYYSGFLSSHYRQHPELAGASYDAQHRALIEAGFGDSDFYSEGLKAAGWEAHDLIVNCTSLQSAWSREQHVGGDMTGLSLAIEQIRRIRPAVVYLHDLSLATSEWLDAIRPHTNMIVGQIASPVPAKADLSRLDCIISSFPHFVERFRRAGHTAYYQPLAFDARLLDRLGNREPVYPVSFVGGLSPAHRDRQEFVSSLAVRVPLECWGYGTEALVQAGVDSARLHGACWGLDMFRVLRRSHLTINHHIDVAESFANNMRLFEATGCGALLITDFKENLQDLFEIGTEVLAYRSVEECADLVAYCLAHPEEAAAIAARGHRRTIEQHTYRLRMEQTAEILERHLRARATTPQSVDLSRVSYGKRPVDPVEIPSHLARAWEAPEIPARQRALVDEELALMWKGQVPVVFETLAQALRPHVRPGIGVLEIGCASGYYYEVLEYLLNVRLAYRGVDVSAPMVELARSYYPHVPFSVGNGAALDCADGAFPIVVSSCVLLHVANYAAHIREAARVASSIVVLHRTPVCRAHATQYFTKFAYGVETQELRFEEAELLRLAAESGLVLREALEFERRPDRDEFEVTYVFGKSVDGF